MNKFQRAFFARFMDEANDGTQGGAGGGGPVESADDKNKPSENGGKVEDKGGEAGNKPSDSEAKLIREVMQKKEALKDAEGKLAQATERLKQFDGIDPTEVRKLIEAQKAAEQQQLEAKGDWERLKERMKEEHQNQISTVEQRAKDLQAALEAATAQVNELTVGSKFSNSEYINKEMILTPSKAKALYAAHFDLEDGKVVGYDKPRGQANRTAYVDGMGNPLGFDEVMAKIVASDPEKDSLLRSKVKPGANSSTTAPFKPADNADGEKSGLSKIAAGLKGLKSS